MSQESEAPKRAKPTYRQRQYDTFESLGTKPTDFVWTGQWDDYGPIAEQLKSFANRGIISCDLCGYSPLRYVFYIETVEWLVDQETQEKARTIGEFFKTLLHIRSAQEMGFEVDVKKTRKESGEGVLFRFDHRHRLGIGSECVQVSWMATPALQKEFERIKKQIEKGLRDERRRRDAEAFSQEFPNIKAMLDELRPIDEILNMKSEQKWNYRFHKYMPSPIGINKTKSIVYRMEKALKTRGYPTKKLEVDFKKTWDMRDELWEQAEKMKAEQDGMWTKEEEKVQARAGDNKGLIEMLAKIQREYDSGWLTSEIERNFIKDMIYRLDSRPDYRVSEKQKSWVQSIYNKAANRRAKEVPELEPGVYELPNGNIYVVKPNRSGDRMYAKKLVEASGRRLNENEKHVNIEFVYEKGAIYHIKPEYKMDVERAKQLTIRYGRCIVCGRYLKDAESVERGIGPVCIKSFR